ncbi:MAG: hypothetical protein GF353_22875 [Candidatus Lokiarchaeota archaeon]|nr:hypothetical protein [Candidatus Lokiarchaeota archaeon]
MIICSNCGAINNENEGHFCRKCGAMLPVTSKSHRTKIRTESKKKEDSKANSIEAESVKKEEKNSVEFANSEALFFGTKKTNSNGPNHSNLQKIPMPIEEDLPKIIEEEPSDSKQQNKIQESQNNSKKNKVFLSEIEPTPFSGSIISERGVYGPPTRKPNEMPKVKPLPTSKPREPIDGEKFKPKKSVPSDKVYKKEKEERRGRLEEDMTKMLNILSKKLSIPDLEELKLEEKTKNRQLVEKEIPPQNLEEILKQLLRIDSNIEASAIIKKNGQILVSAVSDRITESLFTTIGQNLSMIGSDIIDGLSAGVLKSISVRGTEGVLDLAPVSKDKLLLTFSNQKVKSGIINIASNLVKKQLKKFLTPDT